MARISDLPTLAPGDVDGTEVILAVKAGVSKKSPTSALMAPHIARAEAAANEAETRALAYLNDAGFDPLHGYEADLTGIRAGALAAGLTLVEHIEADGNRYVETPVVFRAPVQAEQGVGAGGVIEKVLTGYEVDLLGGPLFFVDEQGRDLAVGAGSADAITDPAPGPFSGLPFASFGDSNTGQNRWQPTLINLLDLGTHANCGVGGSRVAKPDAAVDNPSMCDDARINAIPSTSKLILFMGGTNDFGQGYPLGAITPLGTTAFDNTTFYGALEEVATKLLARFSNGQLIVWMTPILGRWDARTPAPWSSPWYNTLGLGIEDYGAAVRLVAEKYGFPVIDLRRRLGWNPSNIAHYLQAEGSLIHMSAEVGGPLVGAMVADELQRLASTIPLIPA